MKTLLTSFAKSRQMGEGGVKTLLFSFTMLFSIIMNAQPPFEKHYGRLTNGNDEFLTVTLDAASYSGNIGFNKVWIYSNENTSMCGDDSLSFQAFTFTLLNHIALHNNDILVIPEIRNVDYTNSNPALYLHNCEQ